MRTGFLLFLIGAVGQSEQTETVGQMRKQVVIVGAGPSGLLLGRLLDLAGIDNIVLERQTQDYVLARIRAGILEQTTVDLIHRAGAGTRLDAEGIRHHAVHLAFDYKSIAIGLSEHTNGKVVTAYGQTEVTRATCAACATLRAALRCMRLPMSRLTILTAIVLM